MATAARADFVRERLLATGVAVGVVVPWRATSFVSSLLVNSDAHHAGAFVAAAGSLVALGLVAAWWSARHASRLDPAEFCASIDWNRLTGTAKRGATLSPLLLVH